MTIKALFTIAIVLAFSISASAQSSNGDYLDDLKASGYPHVNPLSFSKTNKYALTGLYRSETDKSPVLYFAEIIATKEGADIAFRAYRQCVVTESRGSLSVKMIMISGQKIEAYYMCGIAPHESKTNEVFFIKSPAGNDFAKKQFSELEYVFVHLNGLPIPFATDGFSRILAQSSGKAL